MRETARVQGLYLRARGTVGCIQGPSRSPCCNARSRPDWLGAHARVSK